MNLGLFEGWATGGPAGLNPAAAGAATPVPSTAEGGADPAFQALMDLFAVPASEPAAGDSNAMAGAESPVLAPVLPWPSALNRLIVRDTRALPDAPAPVFAFPSAPTSVTVKDIGTLRIAPAPEPADADDDEQAVDELVAGLFACTELTPLDRVVAQPQAPAIALTIVPIRDEKTETPVPAATSVVRLAPVVMQPERSLESSQAPRISKVVPVLDPIRDENAETPVPAPTPIVRPTSVVRPAPVVMQPDRSLESSQAPPVSKAVRAPERANAAAAADPSGVLTGAIATADAFLSEDRDQSEAEPFKSDTHKQAPAMPVQAGGRNIDTDRNAAMPEFATPARRPAVTTPDDDAQAPFKTPLKTSAPSITFTAPFIRAAQAMAATRMLAAASIQEPQARALPGTTAAQIVQTIHLAWSRHGGEARIKLDPEQFGELSVAMRVDRGVVVARLQADAPQVRDWLHANQDTLRTSLAEHHLRLDRFEIAATDDARESENSETGPRDGHHPSSHPRRSRRHRPDQLFEIDA